MRGACVNKKVSPQLHLQKVVCAKYAGTEKMDAVAVRLLFERKIVCGTKGAFIFCMRRSGQAHLCH